MTRRQSRPAPYRQRRTRSAGLAEYPHGQAGSMKSVVLMNESYPDVSLPIISTF